MPKIIVFNTASIDGFISDSTGDMSWAHKQDDEWKAFVAENAKGDAVLLFGRITYDMMASFWPTPMAIESNPLVAKRMNHQQKVVFSRTMGRASWKNTRLVKGDLAKEVRKMKKAPGPDMVILGSASIVSQLAQEGLIDEFQIFVSPVALGSGKSMFAGIRGKLALKLTRTRIFGNGSVLLCYAPAA
jgi:dihydrofolate reductase